MGRRRRITLEKGRCSQFNPDVLDEKDINGDIISTWCKSGFKGEEAICFICNHTIKCSQHGVSAVKRHAQSKTHIENCVKVRDHSGIIRKSKQPEILSCFNSNIQSHADKVCSAETLFSVAVASQNLPYSFANVASSMFPKMFSDSEIAKSFKCKSSKLSYIISDGLGPYLKQKLVDEIITSQCYFSIQIDETPIPEKRVQQLDVILRYFSEKKEQVVVHHWETCHIGSATADNLVACVTESIQCLPSNKLLTVFSDGPNVMKSFKKKMNNLHPELLDVGECILHKVHNGFAHGLNAFGSDVENLAIDIFYFFKRSSVQSSKLKDLQIKLGFPEEVFLRHVNSRWLTLQTSVTRIIEHFPVLQEYFKKNTESKCDSLRLKKICGEFSDKKLYGKLLFLQSVSKIFVRFLTIFQIESPMIHLLYDEMIELIKTLMGRFLKEECFRNKEGEDVKLIEIEKGDNWCRVDIGSDTEKAIDSLSEKEKKSIRMGARSFYITATKYLLKVLPLNNSILKNLKCLHPSNRLEEESLISFRYIATQLPSIIPAADVSSLCDEFIRLQGEKSSDISFSNDDTNSSEDEVEDEEDSIESTSPLPEISQSIDKYWAHILNIKDTIGGLKYKTLGTLVKALLSLPHGNADVERGFSVNKHLLLNRSQLSLESINALRKIKSHVTFDCDKKVEQFKINSEILKCVKASSQKKNERLEALKQKRKRQNEASGKGDNENKNNLEDKLKTEEKELAERLKAAQKMLQNAQEVISAGVKEKDMATVESGQILLAEATSRVSNILEEQEKNRQEYSKLKNSSNKKIKL